MIDSLWALAWAGAVVLAMASVVLRRRRFRDRIDERRLVDDEAVRRIEETGVFESGEDEPLDLDLAREEERRFWEEAAWEEVEAEWDEVEE